VKTVYGAELFPAAGDEARRWLDEVVVGNIEQVSLPFPEGAVDCVICADVLEHTADPWAVVAKLKKLLKPDGCIVASIPNAGFHRNIRKMMKGQWTYGAEGLLDKTHLRFFTLETIEELFASNGLKIERVFKKVDAGWNVRILKRTHLRLPQEYALSALHCAGASVKRSVSCLAGGRRENGRAGCWREARRGCR